MGRQPSSPPRSPRSKGNKASEARENVNDLLDPLSHGDPFARQAACQNIAQQAPRNDPRVVAALILRLQEDRDQYVRQAAATSLGQVSRRGDQTVTTALVARLSDSDAAVRRVAANALAQVSPRGVHSSVVALLGRLEDKDGGVRRAALKALEKVAEKTDVKVLGALFGRTSDAEAFVRHAAVEVLSRLAEEGDSEVVSRLLVLLDTDRDSRVRWAATEALGRLAVRGDSRVLTALLARLDDEADSVRKIAAQALGHVTFAPLQELEVQERHIAELEFRGAYEVAARDKVIMELEQRHRQEVSELQQRIDELEDRLQREIEDRDRRIAAMSAKIIEQDFICRITEFLPSAGLVMQFMATLPDLASSANYGREVVAPVWALRCARGTGPEISTAKQQRKSLGTGSVRFEDPSPEGKNKRWLLSLIDLFEQLSSGKTTSMEHTETQPLDVYVHRRSEEEGYGLYCCSRQRLLALLMRQAAARNELHTVRCILRPKDDQSFWAWQWAAQYDGGDGLCVHPTTIGYPSQNGSGPCNPNSTSSSLNFRGSSPSSPHFSSRVGHAIADAPREPALSMEEQQPQASSGKRVSAGGSSGRGRGVSGRGRLFGQGISPRGTVSAEKALATLDRERGSSPSSPASGRSRNSQSNLAGSSMEALNKTPTEDGAAYSRMAADPSFATANTAADDVSTGDTSAAVAAASDSAIADPTATEQERRVPTVKMELVRNE